MPSVAAIHDALLIFNPVSGQRRGARIRQIERARMILARDGIETELASTGGPGTASGGATELARKAIKDGRQMVIACGGDGTLNEVVNGLAGSEMPLALLPAGTANILAKELELPWNIEKAAALVARSQLRRIALGLMISGKGVSRNGAAANGVGSSNAETQRYFLSAAGAGPDGAIVYMVHAALKKSVGTLAYWAEGMRQLGRYSFPRFRVIAEGRTIEATLIVVGRTKNYGGPFRITTEADLYGEAFELMVCTTCSRLKYLAYVPLLWAGHLRRARHVHFLKTTTVRCEALGPVNAYVQVDGEAAGRLPVEFRIVPNALTLAVPPALVNARR
jgi:diacylglycerol kinase (ATP)